MRVIYTSRRKKRSGKKTAAVIALIILLAALLGAGIWFGADKIIRANHPIGFADTVTYYSRMYGLDEYEVYAFIKTESGFDPRSESSVGARGLMQIMPDTFDWIRYRLNEENIEFDSMYRPDDNIRYGCYLLSYLNEQFGGGITETAAAYHAGAGSVENWLSDPEYSDSGRLTEIPTSDTAHYVDKITAAYDTYCRLYK